MPKKVPPLTDTQIKNLKPKSKRYKKSDGNKLYIVIEPNGRKWWMYEYGQKRSNLSFGNYPNVSLKEAREKRDEYKQYEKDNISYNEIQYRKNNEDNSFEKLTLKYLQQKDISDKHRKDTLNRLKNHIFPTLGHKNINDITKQDILQVMDKMKENQVIDTAYRMFGIINDVFKYASTYNICERNITNDIDIKVILPKKNSQNYPHMTDENEMAILLQTIEKYTGDFIIKQALLLVPYVFTRVNPLVNMEWSEIDFENKLWNIPANKMKKKRDFIVPLTNSMIDIISTLKPFKMNNYVFVSHRSKTGHIAADSLNKALHKMGYKDKITIHGFRHFAATILSENAHKIGVSKEAIKFELSHYDEDVFTHVYNKAQYLEERKKLMKWWSEYIDLLRRLRR